MKRKLLLNTVTSVVMQITTVICGFILPRLILERYGSEVNGLTQSISQFLGLLSVCDLGIGQVIQSSLYKPLSQSDTQQISCILQSGNKYYQKIAYGLLGYIAILVFAFPAIIDQRFEWIYTATLILAMSVSSFAQYYFGLIDRILLSADQRGYIQYTAQIIATVLNTVVAVILIRAGSSIQGVKLGAAVIFLLNPLAVRWYINKRYQIDRKIKYQGEPIQQKWNGLAQHVSAVVLEGTDNVILTLFSTLANVSIYSTYFMAISGVKQLYVALTAGIQSMVGNLWAKQEIDRLEKLFQKIEILLHFAVVYLFNCIAVLIVPFVRVYTAGIADVDYIQPVFAAILTLAYAIRCLRTPYNIMILAGGHYKQTQKCHIIAAGLNLAISVVAVAYIGLVGIALGTLVAIAYQTAWMIVYTSKNLLKWPLGNTLKQLLADVLTTGAILSATCWIQLTEVSYWGWICMAVLVALIALVITVIMLVVFYGKNIRVLLEILKLRR